MEDRSPAIGRAAFICPHCHAFTQQSWFKPHVTSLGPEDVTVFSPMRVREIIEELEEIIRQGEVRKDVDAPALLAVFQEYLPIVENGDPGLETNWSSAYSLKVSNSFYSRCFVCKRLAIWLGDRLTYPSRSADAPEPNVDLPADIRQDYEEAAEVLPVSPCAAAALLRLAIQKLCCAILGRDGGIDEMIGELVGQGLPVKVQQALDVVRVVGNEAVHPGTLDLKDDHATTGTLFGLVNLITDVMISQPKHVEALYGALPPAKLAGIEQRNAKVIAKPKA
jgi:hypothetical protein